MIFTLSTEQACTAKWVYSGHSTYMEAYEPDTTVFTYSDAFASNGGIPSSNIDFTISPDRAGDWYVVL